MSFPASPDPSDRVILPPFRRRLAAAALALVPALALAIWGSATRARLPDEIPTHFGPSGAADAWGATDSLWLGVLVGAGAGVVVVLLSLFGRGGGGRAWLTVGSFVGVMAAGTWFMTVSAVVSNPAGEARMTWGVLALVVALLVLPTAVFAVAGGSRLPALPPPSRRAAYPSGLPERVEEEVRSRSVWVLGWVLVAVALVSGVVAYVAADAWLGLTLGLVFGLTAVPVLWLARVRVSAGPDGLAVTSWLGPAVRRVPVDTIVSAAATELDPWEWGGLGYRWQPGSGWAFVAGRGPGVALELSAGQRFASSVAQPEVFAAVLNAHVAAR